MHDSDEEPRSINHNLFEILFPAIFDITSFLASPLLCTRLFIEVNHRDENGNVRLNKIKLVDRLVALHQANLKGFHIV